LNCARINADLGKISESLNAHLNWDYIIETAIENHISPLIYHNLNRSNSDKIPADAMKKLRGTYKDTLALNILALNKLDLILKALSDANVEVIVLKGAALAETVYQNIAFRPFRDIDLLIHKRDLFRVEAEISKFGYKLRSTICPQKFIHQFGIEFTYYNESDITLDIHWHIVGLPYSKNIDINEF